MKKSLLIVFVSILLLKLGMPLTAAASVSSGTATAAMDQTFPPAVKTAGHHELVFEKGTLLPDEPFIIDDAEDEDTNTIFLRRFTIITRNWPEFSIDDEDESPINRTKAAPFFFGRISYRYLTQRVLRV